MHVPLAEAHTTKRKSFSQTAPTSQTSGSCSNHSYPRVPFHVQAVGCQPFFWRRKQWLGSKETWILSPPWHSSSLPPAHCCPLCSAVCPPGEGPSPAYTEIRATVLGGISDCCYNISIFSGHEPVCKVQFLIRSRFFQKAKKLVGPSSSF